MTTDDARARLMALRDEAARRGSVLAAEIADVEEARRGTNVDDEHDPEGITLAADRAQAAALAADARHQVEEAEAALRRLDDGSYGTCERCGRPVGDERLEARPAARLCIDCQQATEGR